MKKRRELIHSSKKDWIDTPLSRLEKRKEKTLKKTPEALAKSTEKSKEWRNPVCKSETKRPCTSPGGLGNLDKSTKLLRLELSIPSEWQLGLERQKL